jgi:hypothetical protein
LWSSSIAFALHNVSSFFFSCGRKRERPPRRWLDPHSASRVPDVIVAIWQSEDVASRRVPDDGNRGGNAKRKSQPPQLLPRSYIARRLPDTSGMLGQLDMVIWLKSGGCQVLCIAGKPVWRLRRETNAGVSNARQEQWKEHLQICLIGVFSSKRTINI